MSARLFVLAASALLASAASAEGQVAVRADVAGRGVAVGATVVVTPDRDRRDGDRSYDRRDDRDWYDRDGRYDNDRNRDRYRDACRDWDPRRGRYDDDWDRRGRLHDWNDPYWGRMGRDCDDDFEYRRGRIPVRLSDRVAYQRSTGRLLDRLNHQHEVWHRAHGWHPRNPGWARAHRALHDRLHREYLRARF